MNSGDGYDSILGYIYNNLSTKRKPAPMDDDGLTREQVERLIGQFALLASRAGWEPQSIDKISKFGDLALAALESRSEVLWNVQPQISAVENGPEPSLREILRGYYRQNGMSVKRAEECRDQYIAALKSSRAEPGAPEGPGHDLPCWHVDEATKTEDKKHLSKFDRTAAPQPAPSQMGTPRTDDVWVDVDQFSHDERQRRRRDLSRQLERELDEMTQEMLRIAALNAQHVGELSQAKRDAERQWIPIGSAPSEQEVLITQAGSAMVWCAYRLEDEWYLPGDDASFVVTPTHWMPLPAALAKREGEGKVQEEAGCDRSNHFRRIG